MNTFIKTMLAAFSLLVSSAIVAMGEDFGQNMSVTTEYANPSQNNGNYRHFTEWEGPYQANKRSSCMPVMKEGNKAAWAQKGYRSEDAYNREMSTREFYQKLKLNNPTEYEKKNAEYIEEQKKADEYNKLYILKEKQAKDPDFIKKQQEIKAWWQDIDRKIADRAHFEKNFYSQQQPKQTWSEWLSSFFKK